MAEAKDTKKPKDIEEVGVADRLTNVDADPAQTDHSKSPKSDSKSD